jgi:hypothetical protein
MSLKYGDKYRLPFTHEELQANNNERNSPLKDEYENECAILDSHEHVSRPFSAQYYDREGKPLFFYFGVRRTSDTVKLLHFLVIYEY